MSNPVLVVIKTMRLKFLTLAPVLISLTVSIMNYQGYNIDIFWLAMVLMAAILAHIAVNMLNEYQDFHSGLDVLTPKTPFSGGSGALIESPDAITQVKLSFFAVMSAFVFCGVMLIWHAGWPVLLMGIIGLFFITTYTRYVTRMPWLCLVFPGLAFGPLIMLGSNYVLTGEFSVLVFVFSMVVFFLVNNLLLLNQVPDIRADKAIGRFNIWMLLGARKGFFIYALFYVLVWLLIVLAIVSFKLPLSLLLVFLLLPLVWWSIRQAYRSNMQTSKLMPAMAINVALNHLIPLLLIAGFYWAA